MLQRQGTSSDMTLDAKAVFLQPMFLASRRISRQLQGFPTLTATNVCRDQAFQRPKPNSRPGPPSWLSSIMVCHRGCLGTFRAKDGSAEQHLRRTDHVRRKSVRRHSDMARRVP